MRFCAGIMAIRLSYWQQYWCRSAGELNFERALQRSLAELRAEAQYCDLQILGQLQFSILFGADNGVFASLQAPRQVLCKSALEWSGKIMEDCSLRRLMGACTSQQLYMSQLLVVRA